MFEQKKKDNLNARKEKDTTTSNRLSTLIAEVEKGAKDDGKMADQIAKELLS